jgi:hypothetical protein
MDKLAPFFENAIRTKNRLDSVPLGDRSGYVGASDIAGCPRKAVLSKQGETNHDTRTLLRFARGHLAEDLVDAIFRAGGLIGQRQVELPHPEYPEILCHIDFLFHGRGGRLHLLEVKSTDGLPDEPYGSWVDQLHLQMGLVALHHPGRPVTGSLFAIDLNKGQWADFNTYTPNDLVFSVLVEKGRHIWNALAGREEARTEPGFLCGHCPHRPECQAHNVDSLPELPSEVAQEAAQYLELSQQIAALKVKTERLSSNLKEYAGGNSLKATTAEGLLVKVSQVPTSSSVDSRKLQTTYPQVHSEVLKTRAGYARLEVEKIPVAPADGLQKAV